MTTGPNLREEYFGRQRVTVIKPSEGWRTLDLRELWAYRELLWVLIERDIKVRYKQTVLGAAWAIIQPVMMMFVFSIFFGRLGKMPSDGVPYPIFVYSALLPWTFFSNALSGAASSVVGASHLISKVYFPRLLIPLASIGACLVDFAVALVVLLLMMWVYGVPWAWGLLLAPALTVAIIFIALGVGTLLAALNVTYRDFRYVIPFILQFWMFATPVVYPFSIVPDAWRPVMRLNPLAELIEGFRAAILGHSLDGVGIATSFVVATALFVAGVAYFEKVERRFADIV